MPRILDLTHPLGPDAVVPAALPQPTIARIRTMASHGRNSSIMHLASHTGTHLDAPLHTSDDGADINSISLDRLIGPAVVWSFPQEVGGAIDVADLETASPTAERGDAVLISTGWSSQYGKADYWNHPWLTVEAAGWLRDHGARLVGADWGNLERSFDPHTPGVDFRVHHALLDHGVLIVENVANMDPILGKRIRLLVIPVPVVGIDGFPARVIAEY